MRLSIAVNGLRFTRRRRNPSTACAAFHAFRGRQFACANGQHIGGDEKGKRQGEVSRLAGYRHQARRLEARAPA